MPVPPTFLEFLAAMPGGPSGHSLGIYGQIDTYASLLASKYRDEHGRTPESLRALADRQMAQATTRTGEWIQNFDEAQRNYWRAGMCALDPRLILRPDLRAWAQTYTDIECTWVEHYLYFLETWARARQAERTGAAAANDNADEYAAVQRAVADLMAAE